MNRVIGRAKVLLVLILVLSLGMTFFLGEYILKARTWVLSSGSPHIYYAGNIGCGVVYDRDGNMLLDLTGSRTYASDETIRRNFTENYTYRVRPELARWPSPVHLWCGSKEPYALKSHREIMRYLPGCTEVVMPGLGHGDFLLRHTEEACSRIRSTIA